MVEMSYTNTVFATAVILDWFIEYDYDCKDHINFRLLHQWITGVITDVITEVIMLKQLGLICIRPLPCHNYIFLIYLILV